MQSDRIGAIDALRGYAVLAVIAVHSSQSIEPASGWLRLAAINGQRGVQLFYLLSALSLFLVLQRSPIRSLGDASRFLARRIARLWPMYLVAVGFWVWHDGLGPRYWAPAGISAREIGLNVLMLHAWLPEAVNSVVRGGWSVGVEMSFYLLVPLLAFAITSLRRSLAFLALAVTVAPLAEKSLVLLYRPFYPAEQQWLVGQFAHGLSLPSQIPVFALGIVLFFVFRTGWRVPKSAAYPVGLVALAVAAMTPSDVVWSWPADRLCVSGPLVLFAAAMLLSGDRILTNAVMQHVGRVSYSVYLLHGAVLDSARGLLGLSDPGSGDARFFLLFAGTSVLAVALATVTFYAVEKPFISLGRRFTERRKLPSHRTAQNFKKPSICAGPADMTMPQSLR